MSLSDTEYKALIVSEVGDTDAGLVAGQIDTLWSLFASVSDTWLRFLYAKRRAINLLIGESRKRVDYEDPGLKQKRGEEVKRLLEMLDEVKAEITTAEAAIAAEAAASSDVPAVGELTTTAPRSNPTTGGLDGNAPAYRGDLYTTRRRRT